MVEQKINVTCGWVCLYKVKGPPPFAPCLLHLPCFNVRLSEAHLPGISQSRKLVTPFMFRPPEGLLGTVPHATKELDIWALAVLFHGLFRGGCGLFLSGSEDRILREMVLSLGKLP